MTASSRPSEPSPPTRPRARARSGRRSAAHAAHASHAGTGHPGADRRGRRLQAARPWWRPGAGAVAVTLVLIAAGLLFSTSAETARGTPLRSDRSDLAGLIRAEESRLATRQQRVVALQKELENETEAAAAGSEEVTGLRGQTDRLAGPAGLEAVQGPALRVTLDDAPRDAPVPSTAKPDDLVVHQQDVQAVVNALWAGGAEAMMLQDQRVISTSAVRCVGNTLILQGRVYSPPYVITAIGPVGSLRAALDASPSIAVYRQYVTAMGLGYQVSSLGSTRMPAFVGSLDLVHARVPGPPGTTP